MPEINEQAEAQVTGGGVETAGQEQAAPAMSKKEKKHIIVDPITRIEGHLRIEAVIDENNRIVDAWSSSTMFRGIETILKGRDPRDCGLMAMRICGVCTGTHYQRSIEAVEDAFGITIPKNARLVRNLIQGALYLHDHLVSMWWQQPKQTLKQLQKRHKSGQMLQDTNQRSPVRQTLKRCRIVSLSLSKKGVWVSLETDTGAAKPTN